MTRHELLNVLRWPLSMLEEKRDGKRRISQFRVVVILFAIQFARHWPVPWGKWEWLALTTIAVAIPLRDLCALIPLTEGLTALAAIFGGAVGKRVTKSVTVETETEGPVKVAETSPEPEGEPHEWADGEKDEGIL